ncbi:MAG: hypothetical protein RXQ79_04130 [Acidilobus sp.]
MVVGTEDELIARLRAGARLARDARGFKVWDPRTNSWERVSVELRDLAAILYARQKYERARERAGNLDEVVREEDYSHMVSLIRQRVDPRAPILQRWVEDVAWWHQVLKDTIVKLLPDLLSMLDVKEVDLEHPERTAEAIVRHYMEMVTAARNAEALRRKYEEELRAKEAKIRALEGRLKVIQGAYDELERLFDSMVARTKKTLEFFLRQIVPYLPSDAQDVYRVLASGVQRIWEGAEGPPPASPATAPRPVVAQTTAEDLVKRVRKRRQAFAELLDFVRQASEAGPERLALIRDLLREVFSNATQAPSPSSQPQVITAERPVVREVQVPQPASVVPKELTDRLMALDDHLTTLEERMSKFEANIERVVKAIDGRDRALIDEVSRLREELNMVRREYERVQQLQQAMTLSP